MDTAYTNPRQECKAHVPRPHDHGYHQLDKINPENIPQGMRDLAQWANWHHDKVIRNARTGRNGSSTNPATWSPFTQAYKANPYRLVFVFAASGGLVGLDVDHCRNAETGELDKRAATLIARFPDIYWEISLSGTGLHGIGYGALPTETSGKHPEGIGIFHHARYFVVTGKPLPGYETMGAYSNSLATWYRENFTSPDTTTPAASVALRLEDHDLVQRLRNEKDGNGIAGPLLAGDNRGYPDYSAARFALANKACFYSDDPDQIARILRSSELFKDVDSERDRNRKAQQDATKALAEYSGPRYDPSHGTAPKPTVIPNTSPNDADSAVPSSGDLLAELDAAYALIAEQKKTIIVLQERIQRLDERDAIQRNRKLGAARTTGAALANIFREERPKKPNVLAGYRMPLAKLADRTGLSTDRCSDHIKKIATYKTPDGIPVLHAETLDIPRTVNQETGEITEAHREVWVGPGVDAAEFGALLATLAPDNAPKHGGAADRNVCPDHPDAGITRRSRNLRRITYECACCRKVIDTQTIPVGRETTQHLPATRNSGPMPHDDVLSEIPICDPEHAAPSPIRHLVATTDNHAGKDLTGKMRHSPTPVFVRRPMPAEPADLWMDDGPGPSPGWQEANARAYGHLYRGEEAL